MGERRGGAWVWFPRRKRRAGDGDKEEGDGGKEEGNGVEDRAGKRAAVEVRQELPGGR